MNLPARAVRRCSLVVIAVGIAIGFATSSAFPQVLKGSRVPLNVKLGLWETTTVVQMSGTPPMDTSKMTPEQRTRMEAAMKMMEQNAAKPHTTRTCLTKEKLEKDLFQGSKEESCKQTMLESSSTTLGFKFECAGPHPSSGEWHFVALTPEAVKGGGTVNVESTMMSKATMTGKWISASCGDVK